MPTMLKEVDVVFVYKDPCLVFVIADLLTSWDKKADTYYQPQEFLENVYQYPKHTKIILGRRFNNGALQGIQMAEQLHALGFTRLYLTSVMDFLEEQIPDYLTFIGQPDLDGIKLVLDK